MSEESIENITKSGSNFATTFTYHQVLPYITTGHCLINNNISIPKKVINISIYLSIYFIYIYIIYIYFYIS